ncbi:hypothetical protein DEJ06_05100 [Curtobacterium sp. MCLR17_051]|nr:hypothetical protein DEJ07_10295 [Curtobacterium sp. MCLR17_053]PZF53051.1 hypothetical protein DEJ06_05100 [Curtobacterium sp. MCLR17_051]
MRIVVVARTVVPTPVGRRFVRPRRARPPVATPRRARGERSQTVACGAASRQVVTTRRPADDES